MDAINLMMDEHKNIKRALVILRNMCIAVLNHEDIDYNDFNTMIDFIRNYADKHHHNKEESILFKKMKEELGEKSVNAPLSGMYIEHDYGRLFMRNLEDAVNRVKMNDMDSRVDIIANAIGYADLLNRHIDKEDKVIYTFAKRSLSEKTLNDLDNQCDNAEKEAQGKNFQQKYVKIIEDMEKKWVS